MRLILATVLMSVLVPRTSTAQPLREATVAYAVALGADEATTMWVNAKGGIERDPLAKVFIGEHGGWARLAFGAAVDVAITVVAIKVVSKHHPKVATGLLWVGTALRGGAAMNNTVVAMNRTCPCSQ